jgi:hypothetical protein
MAYKIRCVCPGSGRFERILNQIIATFAFY